MWVCPKCLKQISDGSKICRECGAILEEIEDKAPAEEDLPGQSDQVSATEEKQGSQAQSNPLIAASENDVDLVETYDNQNQQEQVEALPWTCKKCGEHVPKTFALCWNCGATQEELDDHEFVTEHPDVGETIQPEDETIQPEVVFDFEIPTEPQGKLRCAKCGSAKIIPDISIVDQGQGSDGISQVVVYGNPDALFFKDRQHRQIMAYVCGDCGYVELWVRNPRELYEHYIESLDA